MNRQLQTPSLDQFRARAIEVMPHWALPRQDPVLLNYRENAVFKVRQADGTPAVLRLHRPGYHSQQSLISELKWVEYLRSCNFAVPASIRSIDGHLVVGFSPDRGGPPQFADLIGWVDGQQIGESGKPLPYDEAELERLYHTLGRTMARMHAVTDAWTLPRDFERPAWDADGFFGESPIWGRFWDCEGLSTAQARTFTRLRHMIRDRLEALAPELDYGLIHADLLRENVMVLDGKQAFIDFNDCGPGFRLYELATTLLQNTGDAGYPLIERALLDGYLVQRPQARQSIAHLPLFLLIRSLTYVGWMSERIAMPGAKERLDFFIERSLARAETLMALR